MKRLYISFGIIGAVLPVVFVYEHLASKYPVPGAIDLVLLLDALGLAVLFSPIGAMTGLVAAFVIQTVWKLARRFQHSPGTR